MRRHYVVGGTDSARRRPCRPRHERSELITLAASACRRLDRPRQYDGGELILSLNASPCGLLRLDGEPRREQAARNERMRANADGMMQPDGAFEERASAID